MTRVAAATSSADAFKIAELYKTKQREQHEREIRMAIGI